MAMVELLWAIATPLVWLCQLLWYALARPWAAALVIALISTVILVYRHRKNAGHQSAKHKRMPEVITRPSVVAPAVLQVLPVHPNNGWVLAEVSHGLRVFTRFFPALTSTSLPCVATTTVVDMPPKKALSLAVNCKELVNWVGGMSAQPQYHRRPAGSHDNDGDLIQLMIEEPKWRTSWSSSVVYAAKKMVVKFVEKYATFLDGLVHPPSEVKMVILERTWHSEADELSYVMSAPVVSSALPYSWSLLVFSTTKERGLSLATLVMLPKNGHTHISSLLTSDLCSLREHIIMKKLKAYSIPRQLNVNSQYSSLLQSTAQMAPNGGFPAQQAQPVRQPAKPAELVKPHGTKRVPSSSRRESVPKKKSSARRGSRDSTARREEAISNTSPQPAISTLPSTAHKRSSPSSSLPRLAPVSATADPLEAKYRPLAKTTCQKLVDIAKEGPADGWVSLGTNKDVVCMKRPPEKGEYPPLNCVRGTTTIQAPPEFILRILRDHTYTTQLDDMLKEIKEVHSINSCLSVQHLYYKAVWPTAARDFVLLGVSGRLDDHTLVQAVFSVEDPQAPEEKGFVRATIHSGGYMIHDCAGDPEASEVVYVAKVDLKGSLPTMVVNKVTASQPLCAARLRTLVEPLYREAKAKPQRLIEMERDYPIENLFEEGDGPGLGDEEASGKAEEGRLEGGVPEAIEGQSLGAASGEVARKRRKRTKKEEGKEEGVEVSDKLSDLPQGKSGVVENRLEFVGEKLANLDENSTDAGGQLAGTLENKGLQPAPPHGAGDHEDPGLSSQSSSSLENGMIVMETLETYTPEEFCSDREEEEERGGDSGRQVLVKKQDSQRFELQLPVYRHERKEDVEALLPRPVTEETITYPRHGSGGVDFRTMGNQAAAKVLEETFHVSNLDLSDPSTFTDQASGWKLVGIEKDVLMLKKKWPDSPFNSFMGRGIIKLPPQEVYDSIRNPQLRFTYDNMLKELHIVKRIEDGLYILRLHHETTQCFIRQSRDFCVLVSERAEHNKMLLVGSSVDVPECPPNPQISRGRVFCSGWVVEPREVHGETFTEITYLLQVDVGGLPSTLVNFLSRRQPLAIAYLRDYLISTSLLVSTKDTL